MNSSQDAELVELARRQVRAGHGRAYAVMGLLLIVVSVGLFAVTPYLQLRRLLGGPNAVTATYVEQAKHEEAVRSALIGGIGGGAAGTAAFLFGMRLLSDAALGRKQARLAKALLERLEAEEGER